MTDKELTDKLWLYVPMADVQDLLETYGLKQHEYAVFYHFVNGEIVVEFESVWRASKTVALIRADLQQYITKKFKDCDYRVNCVAHGFSSRSFMGDV